MRKDARESRDQILRAAAKVFRSEGYRVRLDKIAERAGVGRGTLYRHFADRAALALAVIEAHIDRLELQIAALEDRPDAFFVALREHATLAVAYGELGRALREAGEAEPVERIKLRIRRLLEAPLARAKKAGLVRADFGLAETHLAARMIAAGAQADPAEGFERALDLVVRGLRP